MRIVLLSINYAPEPTGFAPHSAALAEDLAARSHDVTVITGFPFAPRWKRWAEYRGRVLSRQRANNVNVVRVSHVVPRRPGSALQRVLMEGTFAAFAVIVGLGRLLTGNRADLVIAIGAQPAVAWAGRLLAALFRAPYIVKITDLATLAAVDVGIVRNKRLASLLSAIEFGGYGAASDAIVLCDAFRDALVAHGYPPARVHMIRDSIDLEAIRPGGDGAKFRREHDISDNAFVVLYSGSLGLKQGLFHVLNAAGQIAVTHPHVQWVLVGEGETREALTRKIAASQLGGSVRLLPLQPEAAMRDMFAAADVLLLSQLATVKDTVIPSKLLMYMAAGRPVIAAVNPTSQAAALLGDAQGGPVIAPEDVGALVNAVVALMAAPEAGLGMAQRNRAYAERHFDRRAILAAQHGVIERARKSQRVFA